MVLGVQFEPLQHLTAAQLGVFWKGLGSEWPVVAELPPLQPQFERFGESLSWGGPGLELSIATMISPRLQIRTAKGDRMIQVQNGRLHYNWLRREGEEYPEYKAVRPAFDRVLQSFSEFLRSEKPDTLPTGAWELRPNQWEMSYVNHIPKGTVWDILGDAGRVFNVRPLLSSSPGGATLENFASEWHYEIPPKRGRLHVQLQHGQSQTEERTELLVLSLTARGPVRHTEGRVATLGIGLDLGHETLVQAFQDLTSEGAHTYWGIRS